MLLSDIKHYMQLEKSQSLLELSRHFNITTDLLRDMLQLLVKKGQLKVCKKTSACGSRCSKCSLAEVELYEWVGSKATASR